MIVMFARPQGERLYIGAAIITAVLLLLLIILGAMVRVTDAELICGSNLFLCNGAFPPSGLGWLDWGHRLATIFVSASSLATFGIAKRYISQTTVLNPLYAAIILLLVQSILGLVTMLMETPPTLPILHLSFAVIMFSCLVASVVMLVYHPQRTHNHTESYTNAVHSTTLLTFIVLLTGAMIVGGDATDACHDFPLCGNPLTEDAPILNMIHRGSVGLLGVLLVTLFWRTRVERPQDQIVNLAMISLCSLFVVQALIGAVIAQYGGTMFSSALHVLFAGLAWAAAVALSMTMIKQQEVYP